MCDNNNVDNNKMPEQLKSLSEKLNINYFDNCLTYNFLPYVKNKPLFSLDVYSNSMFLNWIPTYHGGLKEKYTNEYIYEFDKNTIYFVCVNTFSPDLGHNMAELFILYQIYENYFKNLVIPGKTIKILSKSDYFHRAGYLPSYEKYTKLNKDDWLIAPENGKAFYRGNFIYIKVVNFFPNFALPMTVKRDFFSLNKELITKANEKYNGEPFFKRLFISRGENWDTYWHKRFCTNINDKKIKEKLDKYGFNKIILPTKKEGNPADDFLYQIYLMNNTEIIFSVPGKAWINMFFMKKNTKFITLFPPSIPCYSQTMMTVANCNEINIHVYEETELDKENKWANHHNKSNLPYKIKDIDHFTNWFDSHFVQ
jgi:hypothetical protein